MLVNQWLEHSAQRYPDKTALVFEGTRLTYREIDQQANQLAHSLIAGGAQPGDRVIIFLENSIEAVIAIFGALKAGAVFCIVNPTTKTDKLTYMLQHTRPAALITYSNKLNVALPAVEQAPSVQQIIVAGVMPELEGARRNLHRWAAVLTAQPVTQPVAHSIDVDLAAMKHPPTTFVHDLASRLRCRKCAKAGRRPSATLLQLAWQPRHPRTEA